jgi:glycosyltransferase involved in cell wall biosynthesis
MKMSSNIAAKLSIITASYNRASMIGDAVNSVLEQKDLDFEHIIVDGASSDGTLDFLSKYHHLRIFSEPDAGLYFAINKGIKLSSGEVIAFLNSDDVYAHNSLPEVLDLFQKNPQTQAVVGGRAVFQGSVNAMKILRVHPSVTKDTLWQRLTVGPPAMNTWFFRKSVFETIGVFDSKFLYSSDRNFLIRFACAKLPFVSLDKTVYFNRQHPGSFTLGTGGKPRKEVNSLKIDIKLESMQIAEEFLAMPNLPSEAHFFLLQFHQIKAFEIIVKAIYSYKVKLAKRIWQRAKKLHSNWGIIFLRRIIDRIASA